MVDVPDAVLLRFRVGGQESVRIVWVDALESASLYLGRLDFPLEAKQFLTDVSRLHCLFGVGVANDFVGWSDTSPTRYLRVTDHSRYGTQILRSGAEPIVISSAKKGSYESRVILLGDVIQFGHHATIVVEQYDVPFEKTVPPAPEREVTSDPR